MITLPQTEIEFSEEEHRYTLRGVKLPSVTQIMEVLSILLYRDVPVSTLNAAADRGTRAHEQVSHIVDYGVVETDEDTEPYIEAFQDFNTTYHPKWVASEFRVYHKQLRYAGTIDLIAESDDGAVDVMDIKTTAQFHRVMLSVQLAAYAEALASHGVKVRNLYGLQLLKDGRYRFEQVEGDYKLFLHCLAIHNAMEAERRA